MYWIFFLFSFKCLMPNIELSKKQFQGQYSNKKIDFSSSMIRDKKIKKIEICVCCLFFSKKKKKKIAISHSLSVYRPHFCVRLLTGNFPVILTSKTWIYSTMKNWNFFFQKIFFLFDEVCFGFCGIKRMLFMIGIKVGEVHRKCRSDSFKSFFFFNYEKF